MKIEDFLSPEHSRSDVAGISKKRILEYLSTFLSDCDPEESAADTIYQNLIDREKLGSTGIGHGVAVPHCRVAGCRKITGALLSLKDRVDFDAIDGEPVDLIFALVVPDEQNDQHLEALSAIASLMEQPAIRDKLRAADSSRDLYDLAVSSSGNT